MALERRKKLEKGEPEHAKGWCWMSATQTSSARSDQQMLLQPQVKTSMTVESSSEHQTGNRETYMVYLANPPGLHDLMFRSPAFTKAETNWCRNGVAEDTW